MTAADDRKSHDVSDDACQPARRLATARKRDALGKLSERIRAAAASNSHRTGGTARQSGHDLARCAHGAFQYVPPGDPRYYIPLRTRIDVVAKTPLDAARRFHIDFYGTTRGEIAVVGDFDAKQTEVLVNELFTDYRSKAPYARLDREYREVKPARLTVDTPEKERVHSRANRLSAARRRIPMRRR